MRIYDDVIKRELLLLEDWDSCSVSFPRNEWPDDGNNGMILKCDMAYELGAGTMDTVTSQLITSSKQLVPRDEIVRYGPDLNQITEDTSYARIVLLRIREEEVLEGDQLYTTIRKLEYSKYHVHPHGYMARISTSNHREPVRVAKKAIEEGLTFAEVGAHYVNQYKKHKSVEAVKIIFITIPEFPYDRLRQESRKAEQITEALDHMLKEFKMDCGSCQLKPICDEVDGMRELHFKKN